MKKELTQLVINYIYSGSNSLWVINVLAKYCGLIINIVEKVGKAD